MWADHRRTVPIPSLPTGWSRLPSARGGGRAGPPRGSRSARHRGSLPSSSRERHVRSLTTTPRGAAVVAAGRASPVVPRLASLLTGPSARGATARRPGRPRPGRSLGRLGKHHHRTQPPPRSVLCDGVGRGGWTRSRLTPVSSPQAPCTPSTPACTCPRADALSSTASTRGGGRPTSADLVPRRSQVHILPPLPRSARSGSSSQILRTGL